MKTPNIETTSELHAQPSHFEGRSTVGDAYKSTILRKGGGECITVLTVGIDQSAHNSKIQEYVRAVNSHAELVAALEKTVRQLETVSNKLWKNKGHSGQTNEVLDEARAALAKAKGQP